VKFGPKVLQSIYYLREWSEGNLTYIKFGVVAEVLYDSPLD